MIGEVVYTFTRRDGQEVVTAFDAATGKERWRSGYAAPYSPSQPTVVHGAGPKATPLYVEGRIFTQGISGIGHCLSRAVHGRVTADPAVAISA